MAEEFLGDLVSGECVPGGSWPAVGGPMARKIAGKEEIRFVAFGD